MSHFSACHRCSQTSATILLVGGAGVCLLCAQEIADTALARIARALVLVEGHAKDPPLAVHEVRDALDEIARALRGTP